MRIQDIDKKTAESIRKQCPCIPNNVRVPDACLCAGISPDDDIDISLIVSRITYYGLVGGKFDTSVLNAERRDLESYSFMDRRSSSSTNINDYILSNDELKSAYLEDVVSYYTAAAERCGLNVSIRDFDGCPSAYAATYYMKTISKNNVRRAEQKEGLEDFFKDKERLDALPHDEFVDYCVEVCDKLGIHAEHIDFMGVHSADAALMFLKLKSAY